MGAYDSWNEQKSRLKERFSELFENDLLFTDGSKEELITALQKKLGKSRDEIVGLLSKS